MTVETAKDTVTVTIDGFEIAVPKGTDHPPPNVGIAIPRFCEHPLLEPIGACRQRLVEVEGQRGPCITACTEGGGAYPAHLGGRGQGAAGRDGLLLINHPLDCPMRQGRRVPAAEPGHVQRPG
jgi:NADH-quinone oxidoreductase subunit G